MSYWFKQKLFNKKVLIKFVSGSLFNSLAQIIANVIILKIIKPEELGTWYSLLIIQTYALFFQAGVLNGISRELPYLLGKNDIRKANEYAATSLAFFIWGTIIFIAISIFLGLFIFENSTKEWLYTYFAIVIITSAKFYENYLTATFRSKNSFEKLSLVYLIRGVFQIISIILIFYFNYEGYIIRMASASILTMALLHFIRPIKIKPKFNLQATFQLMKVGLPIFVLIYIYNSSLTIDRLLFIHNSKMEILGYYSLGLMALSAFRLLPETLANYLYPRLSYKIGEGKSVIELISLSLKSNLFVFLLMFILSIISFFFLPWIINNFFPAYSKGIYATQILLLAGAIHSGSIGNNVITSLKSWKQLSFIYLLSSALNVFLIYASSKLFSDLLIGISFGVLLSSISFTLISNLTLLYMKKNLLNINTSLF